MAFNFDFDLLCELTETSGVPGYEDRVRTVVRREFEECVDEIRTDAMGNVVGTVDGESDYEMTVAAHMDEIGFMVRRVHEDGFLMLDALGGWSPDVMHAQRVTVHTPEADFVGVIGSEPPHTGGSDDDDYEEVADFFVDVGLPADEVHDRIQPGALVSMSQSTARMGELVTGKALDDRICLFAMLEVARALDDPDVTVHFAATVQEEVGLRGAYALGVDLDPDLAIALDVTVANDIPGIKEYEYITELGAGATLKYKDSSVITNPKVTRRLRSVAEERSIPFQHEVLPSGGTDTAGFQTPAGAKPVGAVSIPTRYLHTPTEAAHNEDVRAAIDLVTAFLETETGEFDYSL
jgi:endoglucanase